YDLRFHLPPDPAGTLTLDSDGALSMARTADVVVGVAASASAAIEPGWVSDRYGIKVEAPVLSFVQHAPGPALFVTLVAPASIARSGQPQFRVRVETAVVHVDVTFDTGAGRAHDRVTWSADGDERRLSADESRPAIAAWTRRGSGEEHRRTVALSLADAVIVATDDAVRETVEVQR
ncbi:MAG TPA: hypothetical protein VKD69_07425, partial [Vicinamibacterales bacterium]|nr:hypothetical protein [Vicinamibacterales bacterium]